MTLHAHDLGFAVGGRCLLEHVDLEVSPGEIVAVVGPNGAGKSTLLKLLSGDLVPTYGGVALNGRRLRNWSRLQLAQQRAVLPQHNHLNFPFSAIEVVSMGRSPHQRAGRGHDRTIIEQVMHEADVMHLATRRFSTLSGGERQRVHLARVLAQIWDDPLGVARYLLLDEPTSALDLAHQQRTLQIAQRLAHERGIGVVAVLHDLNLTACHADRVVCLKQGCMLAQGVTDTIIDAPLLQSVYELPLHVVPHPALHGKKLVAMGDATMPALADTGA